MNFIAFRFCDNDFHHPLGLAIAHIIDNHNLSELSIEQYKELAVRGIIAFDLLRSHGKDYNYTWYTRYFRETLEVYSIKRLDELVNFEGYVIDLHTKDSYFWSDY